METHRCDRCGKETQKIIDLRLVNQNIVKENDDSNNSSGFMSFFSSQKEYEHQDSELCFECAKTLLHWVGHQENEFITKSGEVK